METNVKNSALPNFLTQLFPKLTKVGPSARALGQTKAECSLKPSIDNELFGDWNILIALLDSVIGIRVGAFNEKRV